MKKIARKSKKSAIIKEPEKALASSEFVAILENMNDKIVLIAEGQSGLTEKVDRIETKVDGLENRMDNMEVKMDAMQSDINVMKKDISVMQGNSDVMQSDIMEIKYKIDRKVDYADFQRLEKRVAKLEKTKVRTR